MLRPLRSWSPALLMALGLVAATALRSAVSQSPWSALAAPFLLVLTLLTADLLQSHVQGSRARVSSAALLVAVAILVAGAAVASQDPAHVAAWIPILGTCAAAPIILFRVGRPRCSLD